MPIALKHLSGEDWEGGLLPEIERQQRMGKEVVFGCHRFRSNAVRLWLRVMAYNLGTLWRRLVLPKGIGNWLLTSVQQRLMKTGSRLIKHARSYWLLLAESHLTRRLFGAMARRIVALPVPAGSPGLSQQEKRASRREGTERCLWSRRQRR